MKRRILFSGYDLEQKIHRGILFYAKSILRATKELGYTNYILTSAQSSMPAKIMANLDEPINTPKVIFLLKYLLSLPAKKSYSQSELDPQFALTPRLNYLADVAGFINKPEVYRMIGLRSRVPLSCYYLDLPNFDLVLCTSPLSVRIPSRTRLVQVLPDIIPLIRTDHTPDDQPQVFYRRIKDMLTYSDLVLSISEFSRQELLHIFPDAAKKVITLCPPVPVIPAEFERAHQPGVEATILKKYGLMAQAYFLFVGVLEYRKNIKRLLDAYLRVRSQVKIPLVLAGALGYGQETFKSLLDQDGIKFLDYIPTLDKLVLLKNATAFVFPSLYEGFGLPPLEAMQMGCPVLTSSVSALPEACGDAALYVDPLDCGQIAEGLQTLAENINLRQTLVEKGYGMVRHHSFASYTRRLAPILDALS